MNITGETIPVADALIAIDIGTGDVIPMAGTTKPYFKYVDELGAFEGSYPFVSKVQYLHLVLDDLVDSERPDNYHMNGITVFELEGASYIATTHKFLSEVLVFDNPFATKSNAGSSGVQIRQRFGSTGKYLSTMDNGLVQHQFGLDPEDARIINLHNVHFEASSVTFGGRPTLSVMVNQVTCESVADCGRDDAVSHGLEFVLNLLPEPATVDLDYATDYLMVPVPGLSCEGGSVRPIGTAGGVYLVVQGNWATTADECPVGTHTSLFTAVDSRGTQKILAQPLAGVYNNFMYSTLPK